VLGVCLRTLQFLGYHVLIRIVDRVSRLPRDGVQPKVKRRLWENLDLNAQVGAFVLELKQAKGPRPRVSRKTRAAQLFAYLLPYGYSGRKARREAETVACPQSVRSRPDGPPRPTSSRPVGSRLCGGPRAGGP